MKKFLLTLKDLCKILNKKESEIIIFMEEGLPHYYYDNMYYFEYQETQDWLIKRIDLGISGRNIHSLITYLQKSIDDEITLPKLFSKIKEYKKYNNNNPVVNKLYNDLKNGDTVKIQGLFKYLFPDLSLRDGIRYYLMIFKDRLERGLI